MKTELRIHWDGPANGLADHRLSIGEFGESLTLLLCAYRRIANNIVSEALETKGRHKREAARLDMEIESLESGSLGLALLCTGMVFGCGQMRSAWGGEAMCLESEAMRKLVESIGREKDGRPDNAGVRRYLRSLQGKVTRQRYSVYEGGSLVLDVGFDDCRLPEEIAVPELKHVAGHVVGVGFEPGNPEVRLKGDDGTTVAGSADEGLVNSALELRAVRVHALFVIGKRTRLLWIKNEGEDACSLSEDGIREEVFSRWDSVMRRLSV